MINTGYVISVRDDMAEVLLGAHLECKRCGACMASLSDKDRKIEVLNEIGASVGQKVEIEVKAKFAVGAAFLIFLVPVIAALGGGVAGYHLGPRVGLRGDVFGLCVGGVALALCLLLLRHVEMAGTPGRNARIVRLADDEDSREGGC